MSSKYLLIGSTVRVVNLDAATALDRIPAKVYTVEYDPMQGFSLETIKSKLDIPAKIYGNAIKRAEKCITTYQDRTASMGILMTGDKGTGKTLLMALLSNMAIEQLDIPVILIKSPFSGGQFTSFIESLGECCLVFDEFGKMYGSKSSNSGGYGIIGGKIEEENKSTSQQSLLSLMDGVDKIKRLTIMTENSVYDINEFILNRPSRVYYHFKYDKLNEDSVKGYCVDREVPEIISDEILQLSRRSRIFSFDMLQSIVEEYLRFRDPIKDIIQELNIDVKEDFFQQLQVLKVHSKDEEQEYKVIPRCKIITKPSNGAQVYITVSDPESPNDSEENIDIPIGAVDIVYENNDQTIYEKWNYTIVTKNIMTKLTDYSKYY